MRGDCFWEEERREGRAQDNHKTGLDGSTILHGIDGWHRQSKCK